MINKDDILLQSDANYQQGWQAVGGQLYLTKQALVFIPHRFNIRAKKIEIPLEEIRSAERKPAKWLGVLPILFNSFVVNDEYYFSLYNPGRWLKILNS